LIVSITNQDSIINGDLEATAKIINEEVSEAMEVERVSVWLFSENKKRLSCIDLFQQGESNHLKDIVLNMADYPEYFKALKEGRAIDAHDALTDNRTKEFRHGYLEPNGITSMLDSAIRVSGEIVGVVCHEHVGEPRHWEVDEISFVGEVADQLAQTILNKNRNVAEQKIISSLKEKELLLKEIHHRVKNNLQVVSSLLNLQSRSIKDKKGLSAFEDSINRISSMALVHENLYESDNFANIDFKGYLEAMLKEVFHFSQLDGRIQFNVDIEDISLGLDDAMPCGLIINELVSNSLKYAFPDGRKGNINISFNKINSQSYQLIIQDDGVGIQEHIDFENTTSLGLHLVKLLSKQIEGEVKLERENGTKFIIEFIGYDYGKIKYSNR